MKPAAKRPLWKCPECGERFVTRNMSHSCGKHSLDSHFRGKDAAVRAVFNELKRAVRVFGPFHVYAQKTRIVFQTRGRFVAIVPRKSHLGGHIWLKRARSHPRVHRIEDLAGKDFVHNFRLTQPEDIDDAFRDLLRESYQVGKQEWETESGTAKALGVKGDVVKKTNVDSKKR